MKVLTFSRTYPVYHPKAGQPTYFVEKTWAALREQGQVMDGLGFSSLTPDFLESYDGPPKWHTIRAGRRWKVGDYFSPRVWTGKAYRSPQLQFAPPIRVEKVWSIAFQVNGLIQIGDKMFSEHKVLAANDGLAFEDFNAWFPAQKLFEGQIICWNKHIEY